MIWYEWVVGGCQFVAAWWGADWTLHGRKQPEAVERRRVRHEARQQEIANTVVNNHRRSARQSCKTCGLRIPTSSSVAYVRGMCNQCHSYAVECSTPPDPILRSYTATLDNWKESIAEGKIKLAQEFDKERASYYARNPRPPQGPGMLRGLTSEPPAM